jgi:hypothetical protein
LELRSHECLLQPRIALRSSRKFGDNPARWDRRATTNNEEVPQLGRGNLQGDDAGSTLLGTPLLQQRDDLLLFVYREPNKEADQVWYELLPGS